MFSFFMIDIFVQFITSESEAFMVISHFVRFFRKNGEFPSCVRMLESVGDLLIEPNLLFFGTLVHENSSTFNNVLKKVHILL